MATSEVLDGKPDAGNPHVASSHCYGGTSRFDEGEVESAVRPRCGSLLYRKLLIPALAGVAFGLVAECHGVEASSAATPVWVRPEESLQWKTVMSASAPVTLNWPKDAASARLTVTADGSVVGSATISDTTATEATLLPASLPSEYGEERVVEITVEYLDGSDEVLDSASARLGLVTGVAGHGTRLIPAASGKTWVSVEKYAVLPIPEETTSFAIDSVSQDYDAPGWWEWRRIRSGEHALALTAGGNDFAASLTCRGGGFVFIVR